MKLAYILFAALVIMSCSKIDTWQRESKCQDEKAKLESQILSEREALFAKLTKLLEEPAIKDNLKDLQEYKGPEKGLIDCHYASSDCSGDCLLALPTFGDTPRGLVAIALQDSPGLNNTLAIREVYRQLNDNLHSVVTISLDNYEGDRAMIAFSDPATSSCGKPSEYKVYIPSCAEAFAIANSTKADFEQTHPEMAVAKFIAESDVRFWAKHYRDEGKEGSSGAVLNSRRQGRECFNSSTKGGNYYGGDDRRVYRMTEIPATSFKKN